MTMFDLSELSRWDEALRQIEAAPSEPEPDLGLQPRDASSPRQTDTLPQEVAA